MSTRLTMAALLLAMATPPAHARPTPPARSAEAGGATVTVTPGADAVRAGEPLTVEYRVDRPSDVVVTLPAVGPTLGAWDVRKAEPLPVDPASPERLAERLTLVTFETGQVEVPSLAFTVRSKDGKETSLASPTLSMRVETRLAGGYDPNGIRQLKDVVDMPLAPRWPWVLAAVTGAAALAWAAWRWWRNRPVAPAPVEPCDTRALRELEELAARQLPQKGLVLDFYVLLSDTVRRYVEGRFGIRAPEQTTKEFLQAARFHPSIRDDHQRMLAAFLRAADMVKFAAQRPGPAECERGLDAARGFVRESAPASVEPDLAPPPPPAHERSEQSR